MGIVFDWFTDNWLQVLQGAGIIGGLVFTGCSLRLNAKAQRVQTLINLTQQHRTLWLKFGDSPELKRVCEVAPKSRRKPTEEEKRFVNLIVLHLATTLVAIRSHIIPKPDGLEADVKDFFSAPVPRKIWEESKHYHDRRTRRFIEKVLKPES